MGRTKRPPVVWQDYHDEGAFRSTWTSQANSDLFNLSSNEIFASIKKLLNNGKDSDRNQMAETKLKSDDKAPPGTMVNESQFDNSGTSETVPAEDNTKPDDKMPFNPFKTVHASHSDNSGTSGTVNEIFTATEEPCESQAHTQTTTEQSFATTTVDTVDAIAPHKR